MDDRPRITTSHRNPTVDTPIKIEIVDITNEETDPSNQYVSIDIRNSEGDVVDTIELGLNDGGNPGYSTTWTPTQAGLVTLATTPPLSSTVSNLSLNVMDASDEYKQPETDHESLEFLSSSTSGFTVAPADISGLPDLLPDRSTTNIEYQQSNLWNSPWLFLVPMLLLTTEWVFRRLIQLA